jgi:hypothetical protein
MFDVRCSTFDVPYPSFSLISLLTSAGFAFPALRFIA